MLVHEYLERSAQRAPDAPAIVELSRTTSYRDLDGLANRVANALMARGVLRGDRVVIALENNVELVAAYFGVMKTGATVVPLPPGPRNDRLVRAMADCAPKACITDTPTWADELASPAFAAVPTVILYDRVRRPQPAPGTRPLAPGTPAAPPASAGGPLRWEELIGAASDRQPAAHMIDLDLAAIIYTSGSTGEPRGAMLSHGNISANTESIVRYLHLTAADRVMCVLPLYYVFGLSLLHTHVRVGGALIIDNRFAFPNVVLKAMQDTRATGFSGVPSTFALLLHKSNLASMTFPDLRYVTQAGGGLPPARIREWLEKMPGVPFYVMYGATEASARLTYLEPADLDRKLGSIGKGIPNVEILVAKDDETIAAAGEVGELVARGSNISCGYWNNPVETAERFGPLGYRTGDLGYADDEGYLFLVGRKHDMIKVGAHRVGAKEIEDVLSEHPGIHEAAVVGVTHPILGEAPLAFVVGRDGDAPDMAALAAFCKSHLAAHKIPIGFVAMPSLPKSSVGKIDKGALRQLAAKVPHGGVGAAGALGAES